MDNILAHDIDDLVSKKWKQEQKTFCPISNVISRQPVTKHWRSEAILCSVGDILQAEGSTGLMQKYSLKTLGLVGCFWERQYWIDQAIAY